MGSLDNSFAYDNGTHGLDHTKFMISEIKDPQNVRLSPILTFDQERNSIWMGDITAKSGKIIEFKPNSNKFNEYHLPGTNFITHIKVGKNGLLWCEDPANNTLVRFNPEEGVTKIFHIPGQGNPSDMTLDNAGNVWISIADPGKILKFDVQNEQFKKVKMPPASSSPMALTTDHRANKIWIAEGLGEVGSIDPTSSNITNHSPGHLSFLFPVGIVVNPSSGVVYFSEHNGYDVKAFNPQNNTFKKYSVDFGGFPSGMVLDNEGYLWVSQHTFDKIAVINTSNGKIIQIEIPPKSLVQNLVKDSKDNIYFVDVNDNSIGIISRHSSVPEFSFTTIVLALAIAIPLFFSQKHHIQGK